MRAEAQQAAWAAEPATCPSQSQGLSPPQGPVGRSVPGPTLHLWEDIDQDNTKPLTSVWSHPELWPSPQASHTGALGPPPLSMDTWLNRGVSLPSQLSSRLWLLFLRTRTFQAAQLIGRKNHKHTHVLTPAVTAFSKRLLSTYCVPGRGSQH